MSAHAHQVPSGKTFSSVQPWKRSPQASSASIGPNSNTGQKSRFAVSVDWLTVVVRRDAAKVQGIRTLRDLLDHLVPGGALHLGAPTGRPRNFYPDHANLFWKDDDGGQLAGFIAWSDDSACVTLSGVGCAAVQDWRQLADRLDDLDVRITRCDVAFDDFDGRIVTPAGIRDLWQDGHFNRDGRPPKGRFIDDYGTGDGTTAYVGTKGYRELCAYDKGKQLGDVTSAWTRLEGRFYAKSGVIVTDMLRAPAGFLLGMYPVLARLLSPVIKGAAQKLESVREQAIACAKSYIAWLKRQCGRAFSLLRSSMPDDQEFAHVMGNVLARPGRPAAFRIPTTATEIETMLRKTLCPS